MLLRDTSGMADVERQNPIVRTVRCSLSEGWVFLMQSLIQGVNFVLRTQSTSQSLVLLRNECKFRALTQANLTQQKLYVNTVLPPYYSFRNMLGGQDTHKAAL